MVGRIRGCAPAQPVSASLFAVIVVVVVFGRLKHATNMCYEFAGRGNDVGTRIVGKYSTKLVHFGGGWRAPRPTVRPTAVDLDAG